MFALAKQAQPQVFNYASGELFVIFKSHYP